MNRTQYLNDPHVAGFVTWLGHVIVTENAFTQSFYPRNGRGQFEVSLTSFKAAADSYNFGGQGLCETQIELDALAEGIQPAVRKAIDIPDLATQNALLIACLRTLVWGGVTVKSTIDWLASRADEGALHESIREGSRALLSDNSDALDQFKNTQYLRSDSAATKLYALADSRSIIYDNRVGAALAKLVCEYLDYEDIEELPDTLSFMVKRGDVRRNPSIEPHRVFDPKVTGFPHARWNQRANWIVNTLVEIDAVASSMGQYEGVSAVRAIEAALFVMGDDVRNLNVGFIFGADSTKTVSPAIPAIDASLTKVEEGGKYSFLPENISGRPVNHTCVPSVHDFRSVINCFYKFRQLNPGSDDRSEIIKYIKRDMNVGANTARAYYGPLGRMQFNLVQSPDSTVRNLAENPLSGDSYDWLQQMWRGPRLQSNMVSAWAVGILVESEVSHRDEQALALVNRGLAGRRGSATAIVQVGRTFGQYFGLFDAALKPTDRYFSIYSNDLLPMVA